MNWYVKVIKNYANFKDRARRKEFWMFILFHYIVMALLGSLIFVGEELGIDWVYSGALLGLYIVFAVVPGFAVTTRRLHDVGKSGWVLVLVTGLMVIFEVVDRVFDKTVRGESLFVSMPFFILNVVTLGLFIWLFMLLVREGSPGENEYGTNPKEIETDNTIP